VIIIVPHVFSLPITDATCMLALTTSFPLGVVKDRLVMNVLLTTMQTTMEGSS